jgi:hypothetical protein
MQHDALPIVTDGIALNSHHSKPVIQHLSLTAGGFQVLPIEGAGYCSKLRLDVGLVGGTLGTRLSAGPRIRRRDRQAILRMSLPRLPPLNSPMNAE